MFVPESWGLATQPALCSRVDGHPGRPRAAPFVDSRDASPITPTPPRRPTNATHIAALAEGEGFEPPRRLHA